MQQQFFDGQSSRSAKGKEPAVFSDSDSLTSLRYGGKKIRRAALSHATFKRPQNTVRTSQTLGTIETRRARRHREHQSSSPWVSSDENAAFLADSDEVGDREQFMVEYNRLARKYGIRSMIPGDFLFSQKRESKSMPDRKGHWFSRMLRQPSNTPARPVKPKHKHILHQRRSVSELALDWMPYQKCNALKDRDLRDLVRLCRKSLLHLPTDYAPCSLVLPTCLRATAQYLVQNANTPGIFRVPGSVRISTALYDYYCPNDEANDEVSQTTRCPNLPSHIQYGVHDVASAFKKLLSGLPAGILGSLATFDALVAIYSQLHGDAEFTETKCSKLRARLIATIIGTVRSDYQRQLICSVFGLLSFVGRTAENAPREDDAGRPLPTTELMGYQALSVIFGPLLVGGMLSEYSMKLADPAAGLVLHPITPPRSRMKQKGKNEPPAMLTVDKVHVANSVTEMVLLHWREIVRQMRSLGSLGTNNREQVDSLAPRYSWESARSDSYYLKPPPDWRSSYSCRRQISNRTGSPISRSPSRSPKISHSGSRSSIDTRPESLSIRRKRPRASKFLPHRKLARRSMNMLSPTAEELTIEDQHKGSPLEANPSISHNPTVTELGGEGPKNIQRMISQGIPQTSDNPVRGVNSEEVQTSTRTQDMGFGFMDSRSRLSRNSSKSWLFASDDDRAKGSHTEFQETQDVRPMLRDEQLIVPHDRSPLEPILSEGEMSQPAPSPLEYFPSLHSTIEDVRSSRTLQNKLGSDSNNKATEKINLLHSNKTRKVEPNDGRVSVVETQTDMPEWKQQLISRCNERKTHPSSLSPERKSIWETSSQLPTSPQPKPSPAKHTASSTVRKPENPQAQLASLRSVSRPARGAVKAMAALFDDAVKTSPGGPEATLTGRSRSFVDEAGIVMLDKLRDETPLRSNMSTAEKTAHGGCSNSYKPSQTVQIKHNTPAHVRKPLFDRSHLRPIPSKTPNEGSPSPSRAPKVNLRPIVGIPRNEPKEPSAIIFDRNRELSHSPNLGTMVLPREEPPVAHRMNLIRPDSAESSARNFTLVSLPINVSAEILPHPDHSLGVPLNWSLPGLSGSTPRPTSGNSLLHAQIRALQRQLDIKTEETLQLRRQLETRENMDIGTLSEQLREAKRESRMWKERAEAAEKRVAAFKRFTARVRVLREAGSGVGISESSTPAKHKRTPSLDRAETEQPPLEQSPRNDTIVANDSSSEETQNTEDQATVKDRIRQFMRKVGGDATLSLRPSEGDDDDPFWAAETGIDTWRAASQCTDDLWSVIDKPASL